MSRITKEPIDREIREAFAMFFDGAPVSAETIDTSIGDDDFRNTVIVTTAEGEKHVLKFSANDFTFPEKIRVWQRTVEEYRDLGYYCPRILCDKNGGFPSFGFRGHPCFVHAEEFYKYRPLEDRAAGEGEIADEEYDKYRRDIWSMTARIAAKKLDYTDYPSAYCLFETFCPSDKTDEVLDNALGWKKLADALPKVFSEQAERIWRLWTANREELSELYKKLPTSVFQADLNSSNLLIDDDGRFMGVYDFNLCGREVFLNYLMRENNSESIPDALRISREFYSFSEEEKAAALPLFRCLKPLWWTAVGDLEKAGTDEEAIKACLARAERLLTEDFDFRSCME